MSRSFSIIDAVRNSDKKSDKLFSSRTFLQLKAAEHNVRAGKINNIIAETEKAREEALNFVTNTKNRLIEFKNVVESMPQLKDTMTEELKTWAVQAGDFNKFNFKDMKTEIPIIREKLLTVEAGFREMSLGDKLERVRLNLTSLNIMPDIVQEMQRSISSLSETCVGETLKNYTSAIELNHEKYLNKLSGYIDVCSNIAEELTSIANKTI